MDFFTFGLICVPFAILIVLVNTFFLFCVVCPRQGQQIKQPLKLLLGTLISCTITYMLSFLAMYSFTMTHLRIQDLLLISHLVYVYTLSTSLSSSVWLNFFYFAQIVPAQRATFIWVKKNIKPVIYCIWLFDKILSLFDVCVVLIDNFRLFISGDISYNLTIYNDSTTYLQTDSLLKNALDITLCFVKANFIFCLCVMVLSSSSTVIYLCKHMRRMVANGQPLSCSRLRSQVRVAITGILQGILFVFCATWSMYIYFSVDCSTCFSFAHIIVITLYMVGTTLNLGAGQGVFRQRSAEIWHRAVQWLKGPDVQQSEQAG